MFIAQISPHHTHYNKSTNETLKRINEKLNINVYSNTDGLYISFNTVQEAKDCCNKMSVNYLDNAVLVGKETDSLIKEYKLFRLNERLYHLILYVFETRILFKDGRWVIKLKNKSKIESWLKEYKL